jgi:thioredoxin-dependent peroxiredoxin
VIITPAVSQEEAARRFPDHRAIKPYLRLTAQPSWARSRAGRPASA